MRRRILTKFFLFCLISFLATDISYAAGMLMRVQQMKAQKQGRGGMTPEQQQQYQEYQEQQQGDHRAPAQPTYQQLVDQRNQSIAQAIINANAHSQAAVNEGTGSMNTAPNESQQQAIGSSITQQQAPNVSAASSNAQDVVDLSEVWKKLDKKSTVWSALVDDQAKLLTVSEYINRFQNEGVKINEPPMHYVQMIDQISSGNPQMLQQPFGQLIQILAIIDYDFDNGMDKDVLAKKVLGEAGYEVNKKRFTQQQGAS